MNVTSLPTIYIKHIAISARVLKFYLNDGSFIINICNHWSMLVEA
jgi:hypothetical protein